jgi:adenylate cyclase
MTATSTDRRLLRTLLRAYVQNPADRGRIVAEINRRFQQRLAIIVVDSCSFTRTMHLFGAVHTLALLQSLEDQLCLLIHRAGGRLVRAEADNVYAVFSDPAEAVACALAMVRETNAANASRPPADDVYISVGVGYGDVLVVGDDDLYGDEMNLASKLGEDLAQRDEVLVTPAAVQALPHGRWSFEELSFEVAGVEVRTYRLVP